MTTEEMLAFLGRVVGPLRDYLEHLVVIGGFAPVLYRYHPAMIRAADPPSTNDLDLAVPEDLEIIAGTTIAAHLKAAGFIEGMTGSDPPASEFIPPAEWGQGVSIEILTPLHGPEDEKTGRTRKIVEMQAREHDGFKAIRLRWIDLLLDEPWTVTHENVPAIPEGLVVRVAHPAAYLAQKILSSAETTRASKSKKDHANCYIVVAMSRDRLAVAREIVRRLAVGHAHRQWLGTLVHLAERLFALPASAGCLNVATVLGLPQARVAQVMRPFLDALAETSRALPPLDTER